jgi:hypothetical protein
MKRQCSGQAYLFPAENPRQIIARFDGGAITSDAGGLLLRQVERATGILSRFAGCFTDHRDPDRIEHTVAELVAQRGYALALGYSDLNDIDDLRHDPLLAVLVDKGDPTGQDRLRQRDQGKALAGKSTLNRLELTPVRANADSRYKKIVLNTHQAEGVFTDFEYQTLTRWSRSRRVVGKAEYLNKGDNPRFVVTSLLKEAIDARALYEAMYCARGDMENRIKEQQLHLFADRTSAATMRANQLRL